MEDSSSFLESQALLQGPGSAGLGASQGQGREGLAVFAVTRAHLGAQPPGTAPTLWGGGAQGRCLLCCGELPGLPEKQVCSASLPPTHPSRKGRNKTTTKKGSSS